MCWAGALACSLSSCGRRDDPVAELTDTNGPVERKVGDGSWEPAARGARFFLGDSAGTHEAVATLDIASGTAKIIMTRKTTLRFGGDRKRVVISVESGAADLTGRGSYALDIGDVSLPPEGGTVRITPRPGGRTILELTVAGGGGAKVAAGGETYDLVVNTPLDLQPAGKVAGGAVVREAQVPVDAAVDAPVAAAVDASVDPAVDPASIAGIVVTGRNAQLLAPGETVWKDLPPGAGQLEPGSSVRVRGTATAKVVAKGTTLELGGGARLKLGNELELSLELGTTTATATGPVSIALPGGALALAGTEGAPSVAKVDGNARDTRVAMQRGGAKLTGAAGAEHDIERGESATLDRSGTIRYVETIPRYFDFRVVAGESLTIHDPRPPTAVQVQFDGKCAEGGIIEIDRNGSFRAARVSGGRDFANVMIGRGSWAYRLRCTTNGAEGGAVATGRITELTDDGRRPLPKTQGVNDIDADGRVYRISYQSAIPNVAVRVRNPGAVHRLHLASAGKEQTFESSTAVVSIPSRELREGAYTFWIDRDGVKQDKVSTMIIDFDQTAPQVYIESPTNGQPWSGDIDVRGAVLPGWSAAVDAIAIPIDKQRRFAAKVGTPGGSSLAIRLSHPQRGVHYYLRRPK